MRMHETAVKKYEELWRELYEINRIEDMEKRKTERESFKQKYSDAEQRISHAIERTNKAGLDVLLLDDNLSFCDPSEIVMQLRLDGVDRFIIMEKSTALKDNLCQMLLAGAKVGMPIEVVRQDRFLHAKEIALVIEL